MQLIRQMGKMIDADTTCIYCAAPIDPSSNGWHSALYCKPIFWANTTRIIVVSTYSDSEYAGKIGTIKDHHQDPDGYFRPMYIVELDMEHGILRRFAERFLQLAPKVQKPAEQWNQLDLFGAR